MLYRVLNLCSENIGRKRNVEFNLVNNSFRFWVSVVKGDTHMTSTLREGGVKNEMLSDVGGWGGELASVLEVQYLFFLLKKIGFCAITWHHAEPNISILLSRNLPFDSDVTQWRHLLIIPLHCLWAKSNNRTRGQFECDVTWFLFLFWFRSLTCTVRLLFHRMFTFSSCANKTGWLQSEY